MAKHKFYSHLILFGILLTAVFEQRESYGQSVPDISELTYASGKCRIDVTTSLVRPTEEPPTKTVGESFDCTQVSINNSMFYSQTTWPYFQIQLGVQYDSNSSPKSIVSPYGKIDLLSKKDFIQENDKEIGIASKFKNRIHNKSRNLFFEGPQYHFTIENLSANPQTGPVAYLANVAKAYSYYSLYRTNGNYTGPKVLQSKNFPDRYVRSSSPETDFRGVVENIGENCSSIFNLYPSVQFERLFDSDPNKRPDWDYSSMSWANPHPWPVITFQSYNYFNRYFRHRNFEVHLDNAATEQNKEQLKQDATFYIKESELDHNAFRFEAVNFPGKYIRHSSFVLYLDSEPAADAWDYNLFLNDSSFYIKDATPFLPEGLNKCKEVSN